MSTPGWAVIFDWDGVVVDSAALHHLSWQRFAEQQGRTLPPGVFIGGLGIRTQRVLTDLLGWTNDPAEVERLTREKEALYRQLAAEYGWKTPPGLVPLLQRLAERNIPCAIGSSALRENIEEGLRRLHLAQFFRVIVSGEDVQRGKPAPDTFLEAARRLGAEPARCVVFEDAPAGIQAARAAGMRVIAVGTSHSASVLAGADRYIRSYDELTDADIDRWFVRPDGERS